MADISDLHPAVIHALRTGQVDQACAAAQLDTQSTARAVRTFRTESSRRSGDVPTGPNIAEDDEFYEQFNNDPLGRKI